MTVKNTYMLNYIKMFLKSLFSLVSLKGMKDVAKEKNRRTLEEVKAESLKYEPVQNVKLLLIDFCILVNALLTFFFYLH